MGAVHRGHYCAVDAKALVFFSSAGIWAVINTAGSGGREAACWESVLKANVLGSLRVARTFGPLLAAAAADHPHAGRLYYIGMDTIALLDRSYLLPID